MHVGTSDLDVAPLCLGGNPFGWTADEATSFSVLDAYAEAGGNFIDTADRYTFHVPGNSGGESETIIGRWLKARGNRDRMVIATKVGALPGLDNLAPKTIHRAAEDSLRRLGTDHIDLYYSHVDDPDTPLAETLDAFDALVHAGTVRHIAASNFTADRLTESLQTSAREGFAAYVALQAEYNLVQREGYERDLAPTVASAGLACLPYVALARGFLTGKYRPGGPEVDSPTPDRPAPTSTATARPCWKPWTRSPPRTAPPWPRLHWPGWPPSPPSPPRSPGPAIQPSSPICSRV